MRATSPTPSRTCGRRGRPCRRRSSPTPRRSPGSTSASPATSCGIARPPPPVAAGRSTSAASEQPHDRCSRPVQVSRCLSDNRRYGLYEERGAEGFIDRRRGRASGRRAGVDEIAWVIEEFRTRYFDFTAKHFHEAIHGRPMADGTPFSRGYTWTKSVLQVRGLVSKAPKRSAHRK